MKQKNLLILMAILCLIFAGVPAWADNRSDAEANAEAQAIAVSGSSSATGGTGIGIGGTGLGMASIEDVKTGDIALDIGVEAPDVSLSQTFEASDPWKAKGSAVLPGISSPNLMQQFVSGGVPLSIRQDRVFQAMMALFPMEYYTVTAEARKSSTLSSKRFKKHWWNRSSEPKIPSIPFKTELKTDHAEISATLHPWYRNYLSRDAWRNLITEENVYPQEVGVERVRVVNTTLSGNFVPLGIIAATSKNPGDSPLFLTEDVAMYVQKYFKGCPDIILFDPEMGRGAVSGSEADSKGGGISTAIANFATFNTLTGGASLGGSSGTVMPVSVFGKCFMAMAPASSIGVKGIGVNITNISPEKAEAVEDDGNGKKAIGSGVVK